MVHIFPMITRYNYAVFNAHTHQELSVGTCYAPAKDNILSRVQNTIILLSAIYKLIYSYENDI